MFRSTREEGYRYAAMIDQENFRYIDHPSDIGIEVESSSLEGLFLNAAKAMLSIVSDRKRAERGEEVSERQISMEGEPIEELLHSFLSEILWFLTDEGFFPLTIRIVRLGEGVLDAVLSGITITHKQMKNEIKAITYHQLEIQRKNGKLFTRIIFDV